MISGGNVLKWTNSHINNSFCNCWRVGKVPESPQKTVQHYWIISSISLQSDLKAVAASTLSGTLHQPLPSLQWAWVRWKVSSPSSPVSACSHSPLCLSLCFQQTFKWLNVRRRLVVTFSPLCVLGFDAESLIEKSAVAGKLVSGMFYCQKLQAVWGFQSVICRLIISI